MRQHSKWKGYKISSTYHVRKEHTHQDVGPQTFNDTNNFVPEVFKPEDADPTTGIVHPHVLERPDVREYFFGKGKSFFMGNDGWGNLESYSHKINSIQLF